jgi:hypothetical protein
MPFWEDDDARAAVQGCCRRPGFLDTSTVLTDQYQDLLCSPLAAQNPAIDMPRRWRCNHDLDQSLIHLSYSMPEITYAVSDTLQYVYRF